MEAPEAKVAELGISLEELLGQFDWGLTTLGMTRSLSALKAIHKATNVLASLPADAMERARARDEVITVCRNILPNIQTDIRTKTALENSLNKLDALQPGKGDLDNCEICHGVKGGLPGNENRIDGKVVCDYCDADGSVERAKAAEEQS